MHSHGDEDALVPVIQQAVVAYLSRNEVPLGELRAALRLVADAIREVSGVREHPASRIERTPAVEIDGCVTPDAVYCLECGKKLLSKTRHLRVAHGLSPKEYRERWGLSVDHPMNAPNYSARRRAIALDMGLGKLKVVLGDKDL